MEKLKAGREDLEEFLGHELKGKQIDSALPLESQGIIDSLATLQFIIFLEKKYSKRLSKEQIGSIRVYLDLINIFNQ